MIEVPCTADWRSMEPIAGDSRARLCRACDKPVYDARSMTRDELHDLIEKTEGSPPCMQLHLRLDGTVKVDANIHVRPKLLPLHYLKLDRSLMDGIGEEGRDRAVLRGLVAMARALELEVVAEGIEDTAQERAAAEEGCATMQGFLRGKPMGAAAFLALAGA